MNDLIPKLRFSEFKEDWIRDKLGNLSTIRSASRVHKDEWTEHGVPFFRSSDVVANHKGKENKKAFISVQLFNELSDKTGKVNKNDILVTGGGTIGIPYLVPNDDPLYFKDADLLLFKKSEKIHSCFLYLYLSTAIFRRFLTSVTHIGTIAHYTIEQAKSTPVILPTQPEQQKIANFLTAVDQRISMLKQKKAALETYKKGLMQKIFSQEIRFKGDDGVDYSDWEEKRFGELYTFKKTNSLSRDKLNYQTANVKNIHYGDIHTKFNCHFDITQEYVPYINDDIDLSKIEKTNYLKNGDLVIADASEDYADIGKTIEITNLNNEEVIAGLHTFLARRSDESLIVGFSGHMLKYHSIRLQIMKIAQGTKVLSISTGRLTNIQLQIPIKQEQQKIADCLSSMDQSINKLKDQIEQTSQFKKGLLQMMFV